MPFLIVHGAIVWKALVVFGALGSLGAVVGLRRLLASVDARRLVSARAATARPQLEPGDAVLRGTLRDGDAYTLHEGDGRQSHHHTGSLWLDVGGEHVALDGDVAVLAGTRASAAWRGAPRGTPAELSPPPGRSSGLAALGSGDEVVAIGGLERRADRDRGDASYRDQAGGWCLGGVELVATRPRARARALGPWISLAILAAAAFLSYKTLQEVGRAEKDAMKDELPDDGRPVDLGFWDPISIAAAMPGSRDDALDTLHFALTREHRRDDASLGRLLAVADLQGGCGEVGSDLLNLGRLDDALARARRCDLRDLAFDALARLGRYDDAVAMIDAGFVPRSAERAGAVAIAAGRWDLVGSAADRIAKDTSSFDSRYAALTRSRYTCVGELARFRAGDASARDRITALGAQPGGEPCQLVAALLLPADQQPARLADLANGWNQHGADDFALDGLANIAAMTLWSLGYPVHHFLLDPFEAQSAMSSATLSVRWAWLAASAVSARRTPDARDPDGLPTALAWQVVAEVLAGDLDAARRDAPAADPALAIAVELRGPRTDLPVVEHLIEPAGFAARRGDPIPDDIEILTDREECGPDILAALRTAETGDGSALAAVFQRCESRFVTPLVLGVLPRVTTGREALRVALDRLPDDAAHVEFPFDWIEAVAMQRDLMRLAGGDAGELQDICARNASALADRDRVIALLLWGEL